MNEKVEKFLESKREAEIYKRKAEKQEVLEELGLFEKEYAPLVGYGERDGNKIKFTVPNKNAKVGDTVQLKLDGEDVNVTIKRLESEFSSEYPSTEWDHINSINKYYKKIPIEVTDEEFEQVRKYSQTAKPQGDNKNGVAQALTIIAWIIFIGGFIAGFALGTVEVERGFYYTYTDTEFSFAAAFVYWCIAFISGTLVLGFAEIIKLLEQIKNK